MRKSFLAALGAIAIGFSSCEKVKDAIALNIPDQTAEVSFTVPAVSSSQQATDITVVTGNIDSLIKANTSGVLDYDNVKSVKITKIVVNADSPTPTNNLGNFENATVTFFTNAKTTPVEIATQTISDTYIPTLNIVPATQPELKDYFKGTQLTYSVALKARRATTAMPLTMTVTMDIN
jgi:hypothetical protein